MLASGRTTGRRSTPNVPLQVVGVLWSGSTVVPIDFLGMHFHYFPKSRDGVAAVSPAPTYAFHTWRPHDYAPNFSGGIFWRGLHAASGDFTSGNAATCWADLDQAVDLHAAAGRNISYCIYGTPTWAATYPAMADKYGALGGNSPPTSMAYLSEFVTRLVTRYNTDSIRNNGGLKKLKYLEIWNEPNYLVQTDSFFSGTTADMAAMSKTVYQAAKAVDSSITVLSPSFSGLSHIAPTLNASDGAGGFGRQWFDGLAYHPYATDLQGTAPLGPNFGTPNTIDALLRAQMAAGGLAPDFPIYGMEQGIHWDAASTILNRSSAAKAQYVARISALYAALGWKKVTWYSHDGALIGNPSKSPVVSEALQWASALAGKTITGVHLMSDATVRVTFSNGTTVSY